MSETMQKEVGSFGVSGPELDLPYDDLYPWQQIVVKEVESYEDYVGTEKMQSFSEYDKNSYAMIRVSLRRRAGHTFLTSYLAQHFSALVIYSNLPHYKEIEMEAYGGERNVSPHKSPFHMGTDFISVFEMRHDIHLSSKSEWILSKLEKLKGKFRNKEVIVLDQASGLAQKCPEVTDFICQVTSEAPIVLLG